MKDNSAPLPLHKQVMALSQRVGNIRNVLQNRSTPPDTLDDLAHLESTLYQISQRLASFEEEHENMIALANIGQVVNSSLEVNEVLRTVMDTIVRLTGAERGFLMLRDENGDMSIRIARNWEQESINPNEFAISRTVIQRVIEQGEPVLTTNAQEDPRFGGQESIIAYNLRSILCVPLKVKSELTGVIYADNRVRSGIFSEAERDLLTAFANQAAVAIENARLFASLRQTLAEVTELKNLMDNIFASIASGVITANIHDQITLCNRAAEKIIGRTTADIIGHRLDEIMPSISDQIMPQIEVVRENDQPIVDLEITHTIPERGHVDWRLNLSPLKDADQSTRGIAIVLDDLTERKRLEAQRRLFERMVSPAVIAQLNPDSLQLGGKRVGISILFADIRGFTAYSEKRSPEELVAVLNRYLAAAADAVLAQEGTIDKFLGDAVMAWFNAPIPQEDHALRAVRAALGIRDAIRRLHEELPPEAHLSFGVGLHYGDAVLGLVGTEKRLEYTAIGDSVNTAKRIQENSTKNQILISKEAYRQVEKEIDARPYAPLMVKGKSQPIEVFEVLGLR